MQKNYFPQISDEKLYFTLVISATLNDVIKPDRSVTATMHVSVVATFIIIYSFTE